MATAAETEKRLDVLFSVHTLQGEILNEIEFYKGKTKKTWVVTESQLPFSSGHFVSRKPDSYSD